MIGFAGEGWGAVSALRSLIMEFDSIEVLSGDEDVRRLIRPTDMEVNKLLSFTAPHVVCAGFKPIIPKSMLDERKFVNVHYSLLPKYRGMHSVVWGVINGEENFGLSIHLMDEFIDNGDIVKQFSFPKDGLNANEIMEKCNSLVETHLGPIIKEFLNGDLKAKKQNKEEATWVPRRNLDDCLLDYSMTCSDVIRFFDALVKPYPLPMIKFKGHLYEVVGWKVKRSDYITTLGRVVNIDDEGMWVKIADGLLIVDEVMKDGVAIDARTLTKIGARL